MVVMLACVPLAGCSSSEVMTTTSEGAASLTTARQVDPTLFPVKVDGKYGYIDDTGAIIIEPTLPYTGPAFSGERGMVSVIDKGFGYIDRTGTLAIPAQFDEARDFSEDPAAVSIDGKWGYIDTSGKWIVEPQYELADSFSYGLANVGDGDFEGYIDKTGRVRHPAAVPVCRSFQRGPGAGCYPGTE